MRNNSKIEELAPSCTRIANNPTDMYLSIGIKISRAKLKKLIPYLSGVSSDDSSTSHTHEALSIKGIEFSTIQKRAHKLPQSSLPKIEDVYNSKFLPSVKPLTEKIANRKSPFLFAICWLNSSLLYSFELMACISIVFKTV